MALTDSDRAWQRWGETEPYFGVLAAERFRQNVIAHHREEFWASGELAVAERLAAAERHFSAFPRRRALDFGCGVGRLSLPLASRFDEVLGLDIAPAMLDEAQRNAQEAGLDNLRLALSDDALSAAQGRFDFVLSCIVLQHIPVRRGMTIVRGLLDRVEPGGVAALHVCLDRHDTPAQALRYWAQCHVPGLHRLFNLSRGRPADEPFMQVNAYSLDAMQGLAAVLGFREVLIETHMHGRYLTAQLLMQRDASPAA